MGLVARDHQIWMRASPYDLAEQTQISTMKTERFDWWRALAQVLGSIEAVRDGRIQRGQKVLVEGVGGGFTWGAALFEF